MPSKRRTLPLNLTGKPAIRQVGLCIHGYAPSETFRLHGCWALHLYRYAGGLSFDGGHYPIRPRYASIAPPDTDCTWRFPPDAAHYYVHFSVPEDGAPVGVPIMQDLAGSFDQFCADLEYMMAWHPAEPVKAEVRLWDVLLRVAESGGKRQVAPLRLHPALQISMSFIEDNFAGPINVSELAHSAGVSHNHLTNLYREELGCTVIQYIRRKRMDKAWQLLRHSSLPVRLVASEVGIADLQHFNKSVREFFQLSPRAVRQGAGPRRPTPSR